LRVACPPVKSEASGAITSKGKVHMHESLAEIESRKEKEHQLPLHIPAAAMDPVATDPVKLDPRGYTY